MIESVALTNETLTNLQSVYSTPLSCLFNVQSDISPLTTPLKFYSYSFYTPHCLPTTDSIRTLSPLQTTVCTIQQHHLSNVNLIFSLLYESTLQALDVSGIRLVYYQESAFNSSFKGTISKSHKLQTVLAMAFRGPNAISCLMDIVGPEDHSLALITDPNSLSARYGTVSHPPLVRTVHSQYWAAMELAKWFGGRACLKSCTIIGVSDAITKSERRKRQRVRFSESESEDVPTPLPDDIAYPPLISNRPALLVYPYSKIILIASPHINPQCYAAMFRSVNQTGFDLLGIKRLRLNSKRAMSLNIPPSLLSHFIPTSTPVSPEFNSKLSPLTISDSMQSNFPPLPSLLLQLGRENASLHINALINTICTSLKALPSESGLDTELTDTPGALLHAMEMTEECLKVIGSFTFIPSSSNGTKPSSLLLEEEGYKEEICFVAVPGRESFNKAIDLLDVIHKPSSTSESQQDNIKGFELLAIKVASKLSRFQAKQLTPYLQETTGYQESVDCLFAKPALLLVLRGINCNQRISNLIRGSQRQRTLPELFKSNDVISSNDLTKAFHLTSLFFIDKELFCHPINWASASYVPSSWINDCSVLSSLISDPVPLLSVFTISLASTV